MAELWSLLPEDPCAIIFSVGTHVGDGFSGLSAATREGEFARFEFPMPEDTPTDKSALALAAFAAPLDVYLTPLLVVGIPLAFAAGALFPGDAPAAEPTVVSFDFPDGSRKEVSLTYQRAMQLYAERLPGSRFGRRAANPGWNVPGFWTIAALLALETSFRVTRQKTESGESSTLADVGDSSGDWRFNLRDGNGERCDLNLPIQQSRYIRFALAGGQRVQS
jgi:hypothetical protein